MKSPAYFRFLILAAALGTGCGSAMDLPAEQSSRADEQRDGESDPHRVRLLKSFVESREPRLTPDLTEEQRIIILRDHIFHSVNIKESPPSFPFGDFYNAYYKSVMDPNVGHLCGGLTYLYRSLLIAYDIPSRYAGFFTGSTAPYDSHSTVEVFLDNRWVISDPTFNVMFLADGGYIGYEELRQRVMAGETWTTTHNGMSGRPEISKFEDYYVPAKKLLKYMVLEESRVKGVTYPTVIEPNGWDGKLQVNSTMVSSVPDADSLSYEMAHWFGEDEPSALSPKDVASASSLHRKSRF